MTNPRWKYNALQPTAFEIARPAALNRMYYVLRFPIEWKRALQPLAPPPEQGQPPRIPIASLNKTLIALVPDVIAVAKKASLGENPAWIMSDRQINADALYAIVGAWLRVWASRKPDALYNALSSMSSQQLRWEPFAVDFEEQLTALTTRQQGGQDRAASELAKLAVYNLLPHQLAANLTAPDSAFVYDLAEVLEQDNAASPDHEDTDVLGQPDVGVVDTHFRRCPASQGAQIMSWPPFLATRRPFSFTAAMSVHTYPLTGEHRLHTVFGVRRWVHNKPNLDTVKGASVYLNPSVPWVDGIEHSPSFQRATVVARYKQDSKSGRNMPEAVWTDMFARILTELQAAGHLRTPEILRTKPRTYLEAANGGIGLVYREGLYTFPGQKAKGHPVKPGLSLTDRPHLLDWVARTASGALNPVEAYPRSEAVAIPGVEFKASRDDAVARAALRRSIHAEIGSERLKIGIFYDTSDMLNSAVSTLQDQLGIKLTFPDTPGQPRVRCTVETPELTVTVHAEPVGALASDLDPKPSYKNVVHRLQEAVQRRAGQIKTSVENLQPGEVGVALVEVAGLDKYKGPRRQNDPKFAIRHGMNLAGWLTQFVQPLRAANESDTAEATVEEGQENQTASDPAAEILHSCWQDLWRQLAGRRLPLPESIGAASGARYLALFIIRQNRTKTWGTARQVPIAVLMKNDGSSSIVMAPDFKAGLPLHKAQLELGRRYIMGGQTRKPEEITKFFEEILTQELTLNESTLLLTWAQNSRSGWTFLENSNLLPDVLKFGDKQPIEFADYPGLRHVRIRTDMRDETPEGFAVRDKDDEKGHTGALWQAGPRLWYSTADKPHTAGGTNRLISKVEAVKRVSKAGEETILNPSPGARVWNHQLVEVAVVGVQPGEGSAEAETWAALTHDLRRAHPFFSDATILPWPLHLAEQIGEYIVPVKMLEDLEDNELPEGDSTGDAQ